MHPGWTDWEGEGRTEKGGAEPEPACQRSVHRGGGRSGGNRTGDGSPPIQEAPLSRTRGRLKNQQQNLEDAGRGTRDCGCGTWRRLAIFAGSKAKVRRQQTVTAWAGSAGAC